MLREKTGATPGISQKTENKETEPQKTNSIPFAKPIRRPKLILMIGISILPIFESFVCESQIKRYGVAHRQRNVQHLQKSENLEITHAY